MCGRGQTPWSVSGWGSWSSLGVRTDQFDIDRWGARVNLNRRQFLGGGLAGASILLGACAGGSSPRSAVASTTAVRRTLRAPGSRPRPDLPAGTDQVPKIEHFVVVMMENHSFDNILGLIGRGDGFTLGQRRQADGEEP